MNGYYSPSDRFRNFEFVVYPDSVVEGWVDYLRTLHIPIFISPLHKDDKWNLANEKKNPLHKAGTPKKEHYHVLAMFNGKQNPMKVYKLLVEPIGGVVAPDNDFPGPIANIVHDKVSFARYLCHLDDPEKAPYDPNDVVCLSASDYGFVCSLPRDDQNAQLEIIDFINRNHVPSYGLLCTYFREHDGRLLKVVMSHTLFFTQFIKSCYWTDQNIPADYDIEQWI